MRQKLAVTGALLPDPQLWIMDEPMVGLDPKSASAKNRRCGRTANGAIRYSFYARAEVAKSCAIASPSSTMAGIIAVGTLEELRNGKDESLETLFLELTDTEGAPTV